MSEPESLNLESLSHESLTQTLEDLRVRTGNLERELHFKEKLLNNLPACLGAWTWDRDGDNFSPAPGLASTLGYAGELPPFETLVHDEDRGLIEEARNDYLFGRRESYVAEFRVRSKDGSWMWILDTGLVASRDSRGRPAVLSGITFDINHRHETERILLDQERRLSRLLVQDELTGVYNHHKIHGSLEAEVERAIRYRQAFSVILIDLDFLARHNEKKGHDNGDSCLRFVVEQIMSNTRNTDLVGRYGDDEFLILLPETPSESAHLVAERIRRDVSALSNGNGISVSAGVCQLGADQTLPQLLDSTRKRLYEAKAMGRNMVRS